MKITYDHYYGQMEKNSLQLYNVNLQCEEHEEHEALSQGWLIYNNQWYQSRSTRICLADWKTNYQPINCQLNYTTVPNIEAYKSIWEIYLKNKSYPSIYDPFEQSERDVWMEYSIDKELVGFTKFIRYQFGLESQFNAYIPSTEYKIGLDMLNFEVNYAFTRKLDYLYIGSGYERSSKYKSQLPGFEWWDGSDWSRDTQKYIDLCERDSKITSIKQLIEIASQ